MRRNRWPESVAGCSGIRNLHCGTVFEGVLGPFCSAVDSGCGLKRKVQHVKIERSTFLHSNWIPVHQRLSPINSVYIHHIGKTGGTSLDKRISLIFRKKDRYPLQGVTKLILQQRNMKYISGHMPWQVSNLLVPPVLRIVSIRNPIEHFISTYKHLSRQPDHIILKSSSSLRQGFDFDDYLSDELLRPYTVNPQTVSVAKEFSDNEFFIGAFSLEELNWKGAFPKTDWNFRFLYWDEGIDRESRYVLDHAIERLRDKLVYVMTTENQDTLHRELPNFLGASKRDSRRKDAKYNVAPKCQSFAPTDYQLREIKARCELDFELWQFAKEREGSM